MWSEFGIFNQGKKEFDEPGKQEGIEIKLIQCNLCVYTLGTRILQ
jgi:hypothetical protein